MSAISFTVALLGYANLLVKVLHELSWFLLIACNSTQRVFAIFTPSNKCGVLNSYPQSETAMVMVPELELELESGGVCGKFTTVEGLLDSIRIQVAHILSVLLVIQDQENKYLTQVSHDV